VVLFRQSLGFQKVNEKQVRFVLQIEHSWKQTVAVGSKIEKLDASDCNTQSVTRSLSFGTSLTRFKVVQRHFTFCRRKPAQLSANLELSTLNFLHSSSQVQIETIIIFRFQKI